MNYTDDDVIIHIKGMTAEQLSKANLIAVTLISKPNLFFDVFGDLPPIITIDNIDILYYNLHFFQ